ncbi:MAG TPA: hypothetical protein VGR90_02510, partial [Acidimicrobiales bacterium]|nr:hypothetical protein [Acidimicrobiales bacterium]
RARALYRTGRFAEMVDGQVTFAVPNEPHRRYSEECKRDVEDALEAHFGVRLQIRLVVEAEPGAAVSGAAATPTAPAEAPPDHVDPADLADGPEAPPTRPEDRLLEAFPGAQEVDR